MYFVTDEPKPKLFNTNTGLFIYATKNHVMMGGHNVDEIHEKILFFGASEDCEDFIYSLAGWVGAVNPMAKAGSNG